MNKTKLYYILLAVMLWLLGYVERRRIMTQEQFERAVEIKNRLDDLERVKNEIKGSVTHRLTYSVESGSSGWKVCWPNTMLLIGDILDKYDLMIRQDIDEEIEKLKKEIETL